MSTKKAVPEGKQPPAFAKGTRVSVEQTKAELERLVRRHGVERFAYAGAEDRAVVAFELGNLSVRMTLLYPDRESDDLRLKHAGARGWVERTRQEREEAYEQRLAELWRGLLLIVRAKLEAIRLGVRTVEQEFLADAVVGDNQTVAEWLTPQMAELCRRGAVPPMIPGLPALHRKALE